MAKDGLAVPFPGEPQLQLRQQTPITDGPQKVDSMTRNIVPDNGVQSLLQWDIEFAGEQAEDILRAWVDVHECVVGS